MSRSQQGLIQSNYDNFLLYLLTAGPFASKLGLIVEHHKPESRVEKWDYCIHGQDHSEGSKCQ